MNKSCVAACLESVRMAVESVSGCAWNECPDQRGITVRMCVEWVSESAWNPHASSKTKQLRKEATSTADRFYLPVPPQPFPKCASIRPAFAPVTQQLRGMHHEEVLF